VGWWVLIAVAALCLCMLLVYLVVAKKRKGEGKVVPSSAEPSLQGAVTAPA